MKEVLPLSNGKALQITETALSDEEGTYPFAKMTDIRTLDDEDDDKGKRLKRKSNKRRNLSLKSMSRLRKRFRNR